MAADALAAGAAAVLPADITPAALGAALRATLAGLSVLGREIAAGLVPPAPEVGEAVQPLERLTRREGEVLQLLARGLTNAEIGSRLGLSEHTAKFHVGAVLGKLRRAQPGGGGGTGCPPWLDHGLTYPDGSLAPARSADVQRALARLA